MSRSRAVRGIAALVALSCATLAACSSSSPATPPTAVKLRAVVVHRSDLPAGFTGKPDTDTSSGDTDVVQQLQDCVGVHGIKKSDQLNRVNSDDFTKGQLEISSDATSYHNQSAVDTRVKILKSPKVNACLNAAFNKDLTTSLPSGTKLTSTDIKIKQGSDGGPSSIVATATGHLSLTANGQSATAYLAVAFISGKLLTATVESFGLQPIDSSLQQSLDRAVANRASNV